MIFLFNNGNINYFTEPCKQKSFHPLKILVELLTHTLKVVELVTLNVKNAFGEASVDEPVLKPPLTI